MRVKKRWSALLLAGLLFLCGCERTPKTDVVLFCADFDAKLPTLQITEENVLFRENGEALLYTGNILLRLQTTPDNAVHTLVLTAQRAQIETLRKAAQCAFTCLAEPFSEQAPADFLSQIAVGKSTVLKEETLHFLYLLYRSPDSVTVLQWNRQLSEIPSLPAVFCLI